MVLRILTVLAATASLSLHAAQAAPPTGELRLGYADGPDLTGPHIFADVDWDFQRGVLGLSLGSYGLWTQDSHPHETYATVFVTLGADRLSAGVPRPAYDQFARARADHAFPTVGISVLPATRSHATSVAAAGTGVPLGVLYQHAGTHLQWAASAHHIDRTDTDLLSFGIGENGSAASWAAGLEYVDSPAERFVNAKGQLRRPRAWGDLSVSYFHNGAAGAEDLVELAATLGVTSDTQASLLALVPVGGDEEPLIGAAIATRLSKQLSLHAAAGVTGANALLEASLGWQF